LNIGFGFARASYDPEKGRSAKATPDVQFIVDGRLKITMENVRPSPPILGQRTI